MLYSTIALLIGNIPLYYFSPKSLMRIDFCEVFEVVQFPFFIIKFIYFYNENTSIIFLTSLHIEKCTFSEKCGLFYNYSNITDYYIIVSIVLIDTYQRIIQNRTISILNHHEN